jgi:hypothetical protein
MFHILNICFIQSIAVERSGIFDLGYRNLRPRDTESACIDNSPVLPQSTY